MSRSLYLSGKLYSVDARTSGCVCACVESLQIFNVCVLSPMGCVSNIAAARARV